MSPINLLPIPAATGPASLTPTQKRFNTLLRQLDKARQALSDWAEHGQSYRLAHAQQVLPLRQALVQGHRRRALALHGLLAERGWTRAERELLAEMICEAAAEILADDDTDAEMRALFEQHAGVDYDTDQRDAMLTMKSMAEAMTGMDLGEDEGLVSEQDLMTRMHQRMQAEMQAEQARHDARPAKGRRAAAQQRQEEQARQAGQSLREVYRQLASALHPDRETDPALREAKTTQMQRVNQAYERQDLLSLLQLQLEIEQIDAAHVAQASEQRLKHYNQLLASQLAELKTEVDRVEIDFRMACDLEPGLGLNPKRLGVLLQQSLQ